MNFPPGPSTSPFWQTWQWITDPIAYLETCAQAYGDFFSVNLGHILSRAIAVSNPETIQEIFTADPTIFDSGRTNKILRFMVGDTSILLLDREPHQRQRQLLMPPFHGERMRTYGELICQLTQEISGRWQVNQPFAMRDIMQEITLKVILQAVFGLHQGSRYEQVRQAMSNLLNLFASPLKASLFFFPILQKDLGEWSPWGRVQKLLREIDQLLYTEIAERRSQTNLSEATDILSLMMTAKDETGTPMSDQELRDELVTLLLAGHETTATALSWAFYWVHYLPEIHQHLLAEIQTLNGNLQPSEIIRLPYLTAVCQEALRLYPVLFITFPRILNQPYQLQGYQLEPNTMLVPCVYLVHHRKDIYPEPNKFKPERFLERQYSPYEYLPFGGGNRRCIGAALALLEMKLVLATILSQHSLKLAEKKPVKPQRRGLTLGPAGGVKMVKINN